LIDAAIENINLPIDTAGVQKMVHSWAHKICKRHGFASNFGTLLALDGFVLEIIKPSPKSLLNKDVSHCRNQKGFWGLIAQVGVDSNVKVVTVAVNWPGSTNDITCFRETQLYNHLCSKTFPSYIHIVADAAYSGASAEGNNQIMTPYSGQQLMAANANDKTLRAAWEQQIKENPHLEVEAPVPVYPKMCVFYHELSSERITVERVLGMLVRRFGMLWKAIELDVTKVPTVFCVMCKLHNICMESHMADNCLIEMNDDSIKAILENAGEQILKFGC
jgi:DDE superfamily endonuclease